AGRPEPGDEAAVMPRAMAALAEATPLEDEVHQDNPVILARLRPVAAAPPQMLPPAVDPGLERAMLGHVSPEPPEWAPGIPSWAAFVPPRWWPAAAAFTLAIAAAVVLAARTHTKTTASAVPSAAAGPAVPSSPAALPVTAPSAAAPP